jgi:hypothetical protein
MAHFCQPHTSHKCITPHWKYIASIYQPMRQYVVFRDEQIGLQRQLVIRRNPLFFQSCDREYFYIDGVDRAFTSEQAMLRALHNPETAVHRTLEWRLIESRPTFRSSLLRLKRILMTPFSLLKSLLHDLNEIEEESEQLSKSGATTTSG